MQKTKNLALLIFALAIVVSYTVIQVRAYQKESKAIKERISEINAEVDALLQDPPEPDYSEYLNREVVFGQASRYDYVIDDWSSVNHQVCAVRHRNDVGRPVGMQVDRFDCVRVTDLDTAKQVDCMITDFGPDPDIYPERIIDLSAKSFLQLAPFDQGIIQHVSVEQIDCEDLKRVN